MLDRKSEEIAESLIMIQAVNTTEYNKRVHAAAFYLRQILHSKTCKGCCEEPQKALCLHTSRLLRHIENCNDTHCLKNGCKTTKKLTNHFNNCGRSNTLCLICFIASSDKELTLSVASCKCSDLICTENSISKSINLKRSKIERYPDNNSVNNVCNFSLNSSTTTSTATISSSSTLSTQCENELCYSKVPFSKHRV
mmetsp:Transcript_8316/g.12405  ORF Transcript_8316/g.12405 Transcript_8316/m.12405 type:complete len:196 (+) Transcript_8316:189-776(+)